MTKIIECGCDYCGHEWKCESSVAQTMACPGCGDVPGKPTKPLYTTKMQEAGELPSVGMECMVLNRYLGDLAEYEKCTILFKGDFTFIYNSESCKERVGHISEVTFKPLTPPIELIDGNWYLCKKDWGSKEEKVLHRNKGSWFYDKCEYPDVAEGEYTAITLLTPEVK